ncbi:MAG: CBM35 domain-containing protein [Bacteroidota bacterium]|jgi:hypothetical protein
MRITKFTSLSLIVLLSSQALFSQSSVKYNNQQLFLSGANLAWLSFANDIGPGTRDFTAFGDILLQMHNHGGNALRWWLHTNGTVTPAFNDTGLVIGPGSGTIESLKNALDFAWQREIGVNLCLWSFDMLRATNSSSVVARNLKLLSDTAYIGAYINNCLIPMVDSLKHHPAIISWEIFNEPEGMSNEYYFYRIDPHVAMSTIQRFVNLCAGAIHRRDSTALVTNGAWSFKALTDVPGPLFKVGPGFSDLSIVDQQKIVAQFNERHRLNLSSDEFADYLQRTLALANYNYYSDDRLIAIGGDPKGTLDFYSVHYYDNWGNAATSLSLSPLNHPASAWALDKPIVVAEFALQDTYGVLKEDIYKTLFRNGYAGALAWSWTDLTISTPEDMLAGMQSLWDNYKSAVDVHGVGGDWASVVITSPTNDSVFATSAQVTIQAIATVIDDGHVVLVEFFANDTLKIDQRSAAPYAIAWTNPPSGLYTLTAVATGNLGHKSSSNKVRIQVGTPSTVRLEAEAATLQGSGMTIRSDNTASNGRFVDIATNDTTVMISWHLTNVPAAGTYQIAFGYKLYYASPKTQFINVNGIRVATLEFTASSTSAWYEKTLAVDLRKGDNTIQMQMSWGWMYLDYLAVPRSLATAVANTLVTLPAQFSLDQNYPNPFNPTTAISYQLIANSFVTLKVYDLLGREVTTVVNEIGTPGKHTATWDGKNDLGESVSSGVYMYQLRAGSSVITRKMVLLK